MNVRERMRNRIVIGSIAFLLVALLVMVCVKATGISASDPVPAGDEAEAARIKEILDKVDEMWRGKTSEGRMEMEVVTAHWSRTLRMKVYTEGMERSLVRITYPAKEEGMATLKVDTNIWNYLPKIKRVTKVPASMMLGSFRDHDRTRTEFLKLVRN